MLAICALEALVASGHRTASRQLAEEQRRLADGRRRAQRQDLVGVKPQRHAAEFALAFILRAVLLYVEHLARRGEAVRRRGMTTSLFLFVKRAW